MTSVVVVARRHELQRRRAARRRAQSCCTNCHAVATLSGAGFKMTALPAASAAHDAARGNRVREVPRRHDEDRADRRGALELGGRRRVEAREVDSLTHLGIRLGLGLAGVARHYRGRGDALRLHHRAHTRRGSARRSSIESPDHASRATLAHRTASSTCAVVGDRVPVPRLRVGARDRDRLRYSSVVISSIIDDQWNLAIGQRTHRGEGLGHLLEGFCRGGIEVRDVEEPFRVRWSALDVAQRRGRDRVTFTNRRVEAVTLLLEPRLIRCRCRRPPSNSSRPTCSHPVGARGTRRRRRSHRGA